MPSKNQCLALAKVKPRSPPKKGHFLWVDILNLDEFAFLNFGRLFSKIGVCRQFVEDSLRNMDSPEKTFQQIKATNFKEGNKWRGIGDDNHTCAASLAFRRS